MYGTVAHLKVKAKQDKALAALMDEWNKTRGSKVKGSIAGYLYKLDKNPNEMILVAVFENKQTYTANAQDTEQDKWFRRVRALLTADPVWEDGEIIGGTARS